MGSVTDGNGPRAVSGHDWENLRRCMERYFDDFLSLRRILPPLHADIRRVKKRRKAILRSVAPNAEGV
jgi:hypothetical protein